MKPLCLELLEPPAGRLDLSGLTPDRLMALGATHVGALPIACDQQSLRLDELFRISGEDRSSIVIRNTNARVDHLGAAMRSGRLVVEGDAGAYAGRRMAGGILLVQGNCGPLAASQMAHGELRIEGNAGDFLGGARAGERRGMRGGRVHVKGDAGDRVGDRLRRGLILIEGRAGAYCGAQMIAGTIAVLGEVGSGTGIHMRRGTVLLARRPEALPVTFNGPYRAVLDFLPLLLRSLRALAGTAIKPLERSTTVTRWVGDLACQGKGELLLLNDSR